MTIRKLFTAITLALAVPVAAQDTPADPGTRRAAAESRLRAAQERLREAQQEVRRAERAVREATRAVAELEDGAPRGTRNVLVTNRALLGFDVETDPHPETDRIGALIETVTPGGPADAAGVRPGDVVVKVGGRSLLAAGADSPGLAFNEAVNDLADGQRVTLEVRRGGRNHAMTLTARVVDSGPVRVLVGNDEVVAPLPGMVHGLPARWLDLELVPVDESLGDYFGTTEGLLVVRVPADASLKLRPGDVLLKIGERTVRSSSQAMRILRSYEPGETVAFETLRKGARTTIEVEVPRAQSASDPEWRKLTVPPAGADEPR